MEGLALIEGMHDAVLEGTRHLSKHDECVAEAISLYIERLKAERIEQNTKTLTNN
jgi:hypothetical protein